MFNITVKGGTNAGWRRVKALPIWVCDCKIQQKAYSCAVCGARRPS